MKLKNMIINEAEFEQAFPQDQEFTDWVNAMDYEYNEKDNVPALTVDNKTNLIIDNKEIL